MTREYGTGTVYQRKSDGRWIGSLPDGRGGRSRYVTGTSEEAVKSKLRALARSSTSDRRPRGERVETFMERWLEDAARHLRPRTLAGYRTIVSLHIVPAIGHIRLASLVPGDVSRMVDGIVASGLSAMTARHVHRCLTTALGVAVRWGLVERNVSALVRGPRIARAPRDGWTATEARRFIEASRGDPRWPLYVLALTTGMRQGELLALRWKDIDKAAGTLTVNATLRRIDSHRFAWDEPKTARSRRTIPLTRLGLEALRIAEQTSPSRWSVFARPDGRPLEASEVTRTFQALAVSLGFRQIRFHDLRHTAAQILLDAMGGDIRAVSATLGHSTIGTTVDIYGGMADEARDRAAKAMDRVMEGMG